MYNGKWSAEDAFFAEKSAVGFANYLVSVYNLGKFRTYYTGKGRLFPKNSGDLTFNPNLEKITDITFEYIPPKVEAGSNPNDKTRKYIPPRISKFIVKYIKSYTIGPFGFKRKTSKKVERQIPSYEY